MGTGHLLSHCGVLSRMEAGFEGHHQASDSEAGLAAGGSGTGWESGLQGDGWRGRQPQRVGASPQADGDGTRWEILRSRQAGAGALTAILEGENAFNRTNTLYLILTLG